MHLLRIVFILTVLFSNHRFLFGQKITVSGWVIDADSGEKLIGVSVRELTTGKGIMTDNYGFFSLKNGGGTLSLSCNYLGYIPDTVAFYLTRDTVLNIQLVPRSLKEVVVVAAQQRSIGVTQIPVETLKSRPVLFGEPDVVKALALTPGVKQGTEGTTGLFVRGGTPDQNNIRLDGATVYNTSHLFGFVSVFNPDALTSVTLYKGNMPAKFGGRLSSVLDVTMKEGDQKKKKTELSIGIISSRFSTEGPIKKNKSSYFFSARTSYLGLLALPGFITYRRRSRATYANYWMYDINGKVNFDLGKNSRFYVSFYSGKDTWKAKSKESLGESLFALDWGNQTMSLRYNKLWNQKVSFLSQLTVNRYNYGTRQQFDPQSGNESVRLRTKAYVQDYSLKNSVFWAIHTKHTIEAGVVLEVQQLAPPAPVESDTIQLLSPPQFTGIQSALFMEDQIVLTNRLSATVGVRLATFNTGGKLYFFGEPRLRLQYNLRRQHHFEVSFRKNYQPLHLLTSSSLGLPNDIWVPATNQVAPASSVQVSGGWHYQWQQLRTNFSVEAYYRNMNDLIDYRQGLSFFTTDQNWQDIILKNGRGRAYGLEFMAHRSAGVFTGWLSYTLAWNERKFSGINSGNWYPHQYDRRHEVAFTGTYPLSEKWTAAANFVFSTGNAFTSPAYLAVIFSDGQTADDVPIFTGKNNRRGPVYHRLDLSMTKTYTSRRGRVSNWSFGVYNAYANKNPFYLSTETLRIYSSTPGDLGKTYIKYTIGSVFKFIPSISYGVKF